MKFKDKKILIIGPSEQGVYDEENISLNEYDIIVRLNNHWQDHKKRTDIVCNCLNKDKISEEMISSMKARNIMLLIRNDYSVIKDDEKIRNFRKINNCEFGNFEYIPDRYFKECNKILGKSPSTGFLCIYFFINQDIGKLSIVGFDFYKTLSYKENNEHKRKNALNVHPIEKEKTQLIKYNNIDYLGETLDILKGME
jgi:hypothetical protein